MSEHLHGDFLMRCRQRKPRRRYAMAKDAALVMALFALLGWLLAMLGYVLALRSTLSGAAAAVRIPGLAMMPLAVMDGHSAAGLACLAVVGLAVAVCVGLAVRKQRQWDDEQSWEDEYAGYDRAENAVREALAPDPLALPAPGLNVEELRRILGSLLQQTQEARGLVKRAQSHLSVEEYGQDLDHAYLLMGLAVGCLAELLARTDPGLKGGPEA